MVRPNSKLEKRNGGHCSQPLRHFKQSNTNIIRWPYEIQTHNVMAASALFFSHPHLLNEVSYATEHNRFFEQKKRKKKHNCFST